MGRRDAIRVAEAVRTACVVAAERAYEDGGVSGLCAEGRWELAVEAIRDLDLRQVLAPWPGNSRDGPAPAPAGRKRARKM